MSARHAGTTVTRPTPVVRPAASQPQPAPAARTSRRPTRRGRPVALLVALVAGGAVAGLLGWQQGPIAVAEEPMPVSSMIGSDAEGLDEALEVSPQMAVSEADAASRLADMAASRAARKAAADAQAQADAEAAEPETVMPIHGARLSSCFCMRWGVMHWGIDLAAPMLTPEYAAEAGIVLRAGAASGFGQAVYIKHENGDVTVYGHMEKILVQAGDYVEAGDTIALLGMRGQSTGPHLHFEVHQGGVDGKRIDPIVWLRKRGVDI